MKPPNGKYLVENIITQLKRRILESKLSPGAFFATEEQLCNEFDASRNIIRDAVGRLRGLGILESRRKAGLVVGNVDPMDLFEIGISFYTCNISNFHQLTQLRFILEIGSIEYSVQNASDEQIKELKKLADEHQQLILQHADFHQINEIDQKFHDLILETSQNELVHRMHSIISTYFENANRMIEKFNNVMYSDEEFIKLYEPSIRAHQMIVMAFQVRDPEQARCLLTLHLKEGMQYQLELSNNRKFLESNMNNSPDISNLN